MVLHLRILFDRQGDVLTSLVFQFRTSLSVYMAIFCIVATGCSDNAFLGIGGGGESDEGAYGSESNPAYVDMSQFDQGCETGGGVRPRESPGLHGVQYELRPNGRTSKQGASALRGSEIRH